MYKYNFGEIYLEKVAPVHQQLKQMKAELVPTIVSSIDRDSVRVVMMLSIQEMRIANHTTWDCNDSY